MPQKSGPPDRFSDTFWQRKMRTLLQRPGKAAASMALLWGGPGLLILPFLMAAGVGAEVLWGLGTTVLLTFAVLSAIGGLFVRSWWLYSGFSLLAYLVLALAYAAVVLVLHKDADAELGTFSSMYSAFFLSFFMIHGVTGAVRRIAGMAGLQQAEDPPT